MYKLFEGKLLFMYKRKAPEGAGDLGPVQTLNRIPCTS